MSDAARPAPKHRVTETKADLSSQNVDQEKAGFLFVLKARETLLRIKQSS